MIRFILILLLCCSCSHRITIDREKKKQKHKGSAVIAVRDVTYSFIFGMMIGWYYKSN